MKGAFPRLKTRLPTLWTTSYFVSTTGGAPLELVKKYIEGQQRGEESLQVPLVSEHKAQIREEDQHLHSQVLQDVLLRLDKAFKAFFGRVKNGQNPGYPPLQGRNR
jgi:hypothetical protein